MTCKEIWIDIIIPLLASLIGGLVTLLGVVVTIKHETKCRKEDEKRLYKPFFASLNSYDDKIDKNTSRIDFQSDDDKGMHELLFGNIQNFDFSHFIIEKVVISDTEYYPVTNSVISKNETISLYVYGSKKEVNAALLYVYDVLGNQYIYDMIIGAKTPERNYSFVEKYILIREKKSK